MAALATGDSAEILKLRQPDHLDSRAAQCIHLALQQRLGNAGPVVLGNRNSQDYSRIHQRSTTSYVVQVFEEEAGPGWPVRRGEEVWCFAGDTFFGRHVLPAMLRPERSREVIRRVTRITGGAALVVNLEGVLVPSVANPKAQRPLAMDEAFAIKCMSELGVRVAGLANNHALDLGLSAREQTAAALKRAGIEPLHDGEWLDCGRFRLLGLTDLCNGSEPRFHRLSEDGVANLMGKFGGGKPGIVFVHWGDEWQAPAGPRQKVLQEWLTAPVGGGVVTGEHGSMILQSRPSGLSLVLGAHPHVASDRLQLTGPDRVIVAASLGNLIFDQPRGTGALVEVRFFPCGTHAVRRIPLGNVLTAGKDFSGHSD
jgi:poly-gamma-glutamate synthesis protein (capsule biosynthesis protein)